MTTGETSRAEAFRKILDKYGSKPLPPDHPVYSEGPSTILLPARSHRSKAQKTDQPLASTASSQSEESGRDE